MVTPARGQARERSHRYSRGCAVRSSLRGSRGATAFSSSFPEPVWIDVEAAPCALAQAPDATEPADALARAQAAIALVEPGLLPGLEAPWLAEQRSALDHLRIEALELAATAAQTAEPALAEGFARQAVAAAPFREATWVALIGALRVRGNVAQALHPEAAITIACRPSGKRSNHRADARSIARATAARACRNCADRATGERFRSAARRS